MRRFYLRNANANVLVAVHDGSIEWFVEDVCYARADVGEQTDGVPDEVRRAQDAVQLAEHLLAVMVHDALLEVWKGQAHVLDCQRVHLQRCVVDVPDGHSDCIENHRKGVPQAEPENDLSDALAVTFMTRTAPRC